LKSLKPTGHNPMPPPPPTLSQPLTYSKSITLTLTHDCPWHCSYCGFRSDGEGLLSDEHLAKLLAQARQQGAREALLISGENPAQLPHIRQELTQRGFVDFIAFAIHVAAQAIHSGLLPHGNYGALSQQALQRLRPWHVSMGVMLENIQDFPHIAAEKRSRGRLNTLEAAGRARIPFTSGILTGLGETMTSLLESLDALADTHRHHGQLQEILIQNYIPNHGSQLQPSTPPLSLDDYLKLITHWRQLCPDVPIQIPPNLNPFWKDLLPYIDDLGGISLSRDEVNPLNPWAPLETYTHAAHQAGRALQERYAIYPRFINSEWLDSTHFPQLTPSSLPAPQTTPSA
jgi:7,8-didemethyl-8-hydroxy-5-deazariboflavin synthase CofG subunit